MTLPPRDPEPCDTCDLGFMHMICYDGLRRCYNCVHTLAEQNGWDEVPEFTPVEPSPALGEKPLLSPQEKKALREEKKAKGPARLF